MSLRRHSACFVAFVASLGAGCGGAHAPAQDRPGLAVEAEAGPVAGPDVADAGAQLASVPAAEVPVPTCARRAIPPAPMRPDRPVRAGGGGRRAESPIVVELRELDGDARAPLALVLTSPGIFPCLGYEYPVKLMHTGRRLRLHVGPVKAPKGYCPSAIGPARGFVALPRDLDGTYQLEVTQSGKTDIFELRSSARQIELITMGEPTVTEPRGPLAQLRVPAHAMHIACWASADARCVLPGGEPVTCAAVLGDPVLSELPAAQLEAGRYSREVFNGADGCYVDVGNEERVGQLARHIGERWHSYYFVGDAGISCLRVVLTTWSGGQFVNPR